MLAAERRNLIIEKIFEDKSVVVSELAREYGVTEETIRRDLDKLEEEGYVVKSYGGATLSEASPIDLPYNVRRKANPIGKQKIAELVCAQIGEGDHIFLDASTTSVFIARSLKVRERLTVITNSIENLIELSDADVSNWEIIAPGGLYRPGTMSFGGWKTAEALRAYHADKVFFSCKGVDLNKGITDGTDEIAGIKQAMIESATRVYLAVDSNKFDRTAFSQICDFGSVDVVITDKKPEQKWIEFLTQKGVELIYPEESQVSEKPEAAPIIRRPRVVRRGAPLHVKAVTTVVDLTEAEDIPAGEEITGQAPEETAAQVSEEEAPLQGSEKEPQENREPETVIVSGTGAFNLSELD